MLVLFDVDGTLTATTSVDAEVYARVFDEVFGVALPTTDWGEYRCPTDRGIAEEAVRRLRLEPGGIPEFERRFISELGRELERRGARPVAGAASVLDLLEASNHAVALATGAWERSARLKLAAAGVRLGQRVLVGSDHHPCREDIIREARHRAGAARPAVYVGDAPWDARAARALDLPFVGIDPAGTGALRAAHVRQVVPDYQDREAFIAALHEATVP